MTRQITRAQAIEALRTAYARRLDSETSMCKYAADHGVFCGGFNRFRNGDLRERFRWIVEKDLTMTREALEELANRWQVARQDVDQLPIACDVQQREHDLCNGWNDFSNDDLAKFYAEVFKLEVSVA
jgi:hypothetical protein